jgi:ribose transport system substrate-binding protein
MKGSTMRRSRLRSSVGVSTIALLVLVATGCASTTTDEDTGSTEVAETATAEQSTVETPAGGGIGGGVTAENSVIIEERLAQYLAVPEWRAPGPTFDASAASGKTIFSIPISSGIPFINAIEESQAQIAESLGINYISYQNQGSPNEWVQGMNQAISQKVDLIILSALPNPADLQPQIKAAQKAGIPVISTNGPDPETYPPNTIPEAGTANLTSFVPGPFMMASKLQADWVIKDSKGEANVLVLTANDVLSAKGAATEIMDEFERMCPSCKTTLIDTPVVSWATDIQTKVQTELSKDPSIKYIVPIYSAMGVLSQPAIIAAGRDDVSIVTYDGDTGALKQVQDDTAMKVLVGEGSQWAAYVFMDRAMRTVLDLEIPANDPTLIGIRLFTKDNATEAGIPPVFTKGYGDAFVKGFTDLWQLSGPPTS